MPYKINFVIYVATSPSGKSYVGKDSRWPRRKASHILCSKNPNNREYNLAFHCALRKYGPDNFVWKIEYENIKTEEELNLLEINTIQKYNSHNNGYNETLGGEGKLGYKHSLRSKKLMSNSKKGIFSGSKNPNFGKHWSDEWKKQHSDFMKKRLSIPENRPAGEKNGMYGKKMNNEQRKKCSERNIKRYENKTIRDNMAISCGGKPFNVYKKDTMEYVGTFVNMKDFAKDIGGSSSRIWCCLNNYPGAKSHKGYIFRYIDD